MPAMSDPLPFLPTTATLMPLPQACDALPVGHFLGDFEIREVIGVGGFGIVYRAWEGALERDVAIKEYMPMGMVGRNADGQVTLRSKAWQEDFDLGLRSFLNEARLLARFDHPSLVKVHRFWEANGTACMVMPFYRAQTLRQRRQELGAVPVTEAWLLSMLEPLLGALAQMHRAEVFHRDIAPDNILWCADDRPVLLDFGAARRVLADRTQHLTAVLKPQFAPIEQYADAHSMRQGPWTDIFALASTCYFMLTGRPPLPATARILSDDMTPLAELAPPGFSPRVLATLDWAMAVRPGDQSVAALWDVLHGHAKVPERLPPFRASPAAESVNEHSYARTIQTPMPAGLDVATPASEDADRIESTNTARQRRMPRLKPQQWLLGLAIASGAGYALLPNHAGAPGGEVAIAADPGATGASAAPPSAIARPLPDEVAGSAPRAGTATPRSAAASAPAPAMGPRETCIADKAANVEDCVRHACKSDPRFKRSSTCAKPPRPARPWWKIFKSG